MRLPALLSFVLVLALALARGGTARASPRDPREPREEEALASGEIDREDLVARGAGTVRDAPRSAPGGHAWLSLAGFTRPSPLGTGTREIGGLLVVGLPFDRLARTNVRATLADPTPPPRPPPPPPAPSPAPDADALLVLGPRLARACVEAAWRAAGLGADDARLDAVMSRARWAGLLPEARLRVIRWDDERVYADTAPERLRDSAGANVGLEARLTWRLDRLLFAEDEPSFERIRLERQDARARLAGRTLEALFRWQRAWLEARAIGHPDPELALRVAEAEATLDVLTAGWFSVWRAPRLAVAPVESP